MVLLVLAAWRVWKLIGDDVIFDRPRAWLIDALVNARPPFKTGGERRAAYWSDFLSCPYCLGTWCFVIWWGAWMLAPDVTLISAGVIAGSALVGLLGTIWGKLTD